MKLYYYHFFYSIGKYDSLFLFEITSYYVIIIKDISAFSFSFFLSIE